MILNGVEVDSIHLNPDAIAEILRDAHANGNLPHHWIVNTDSKLIELSIGGVRNCWISDKKRKGSGSKPVEDFPLQASIPVCFNFRSSGILADTGINGYAIINVAMLFEVPIHKGTIPPHLKDHLRIDFAATNTEDITLLLGSGNSNHDLIIRTALVNFIHKTFSGTFPLPSEIRQLIVKDNALEIKPISGPQQQLMIRSFKLNELSSNQTKKKENLTVEPIILSKRTGPAWAAIASKQPILEKIEKLMSHINVVIKSDNASPSINVNTVNFYDGFIEFDDSRKLSTKIKAKSYKPCVHSFINSSTLINSNKFNKVTEEIFVDPKSKAYVESEIDNAMLPSHDQFKSASISFFSSQNSRVEARFLYPEFRSKGMILHGSIDRLGDGGPPMADFSFLRIPDNMTCYTFDAARSWSPTSELVESWWNKLSHQLLK